MEPSQREGELFLFFYPMSLLSQLSNLFGGSIY